MKRFIWLFHVDEHRVYFSTSPTISNLAQNLQPIVAITMGDPAGIGPEVCLKLLQNPEVRKICIPVVLGDLQSLKSLPAFESVEPGLTIIKKCDADRSQIDSLTQATLIDFATSRIDQVEFGSVSNIAGAAAYEYIDTAIRWHQENWVDGITTGPINKLALHAAGHFYPGHTEIFAERSATENFCMMQYSDELTCSFVTTHVGYSEVPELLTVERIEQVIQLSADALRSIRGANPRLVVCGLNPHAGEEGLFGNLEEENIIVPAIERARKSGLDVEGPFPPDTCFIPTRRKTTDCFICMYHDQGHIPLKALVFDQAVNMTLGLPIIRTSVDHGTAFDIVGQNKADPSSLIQAVKLAAKLAISRTSSHKQDVAPAPKLLSNRKSIIATDH